MEVSRVNATMALEDQLAQDPHLLNDLADEMVAKNIKQIWENNFFLCFAELLIGLKCLFFAQKRHFVHSTENFC